MVKATTELASQAMTLARRLWVHRGVFGLHHHRYHDSEAFGGTSGTGALVYFDRMTNAQQIRHPFCGEKPFGLASEALKAYHEKALNEETEALAMLVSGITLTVTTMPVDLDGLKDTPEVAEAIRQEQGEVTAVAFIMLSVPEKVDGFIKLEVPEHLAVGEDDPFGLNDGATSLEYKKVGDEFTLVKSSLKGHKEHSFVRSGNTFELNINFGIEKKKYSVVFSLSAFDAQYIPVAQDKTYFKG